MAERRRRRSVVGTVLRGSMTPMIDVTFLLLVFFLSTTRWASEERVIAMDLARREAEVDAAPAAAPAPPPTPPEDPFVLRDESLRLAVRADGSVEAGTPLNRRLSLPDLRAALAAECRGVAHPTGMFEPSFPIVISPTDDAPWEVAVSALDAATAAGFRNVGFERLPGRPRAGAQR